MKPIRCDVCPHACMLQEGQTGRCRARKNVSGVNLCDNYGRLTSIALDPVEKKPLRRFYPGSYILSIGSYGCNLACPYCQNASISMADASGVYWNSFSPEELVQLLDRYPESIGIAFTYNEMGISWEYIRDTASLVHARNQKTVLVTNGCLSSITCNRLRSSLDALNIDLKGDASYYRELGGDYETVKQTIAFFAGICHVEVTMLIVPGKNDSDAWMESEAKWLASISPDIPLHLSRYFPRWHSKIPATPVETILHLQQIAEQYLHYVYTGNL